tara:strand:+ start:9824 stop:11194 length:1371 start_codon:yes stop_codon:yes gene_type:complete
MKKYSDKYLNNYKVLSKAILGFEFECYFNSSFYKILELLNNELDPVNVHGFRTYHSDFVPDANNFKLERDLSGGENMAEIVTGPLDYYSAKYYLVKILKFIDKHGYTNNNCSLHINLSFDGEDLNDLNILKQILTIDEDEIYSKFPSRKNNIYAKSVQNIIPFKDYDFGNISIGNVKNILRIPKSKYYGVNFLNVNEPKGQRVEFRYIGGENYQKQVGDILELADKMIITTHNNIKSGFDNNDIDKLMDFLDDKINNFKNLSTYDSFLVEYPNVQLQIDMDPRYEIISAHYPKLYNTIYTFLQSVENLGECIINYYVSSNKMEIVNGNFTAVLDLNGYDFINCEIYGGIFTNSNMFNCKVINSEIQRSRLGKSDIKSAKLISTNADECELEDCFFQAGLLNSHMEGGIFRSGKIGPYATFSDETTIVGKEKENFFQTKYDEDEELEDEKVKKFPKG